MAAFTDTDRTQVEAVRDAVRALAKIVEQIPAAADTESDIAVGLYRLTNQLNDAAFQAETVLLVADIEAQS